MKRFAAAGLALLLSYAVTAVAQPTTAPTTTSRQRPEGAGTLAGFDISPHFDEQIKQYRIEPGIQILVNAPSPRQFDPRKPTRIVFFTLPNGNTTAETFGRKYSDPSEWHYGIQHIGAQTRQLRSVINDANLVVVYLEADGKSWPAWKKKYDNHRQLINRAIDSVRELFAKYNPTCELSGHSGGGSFNFAFLDSVEHIPARITRITFLDSNYNYNDDESRHGEKLIAWLKADPTRCLCVIAYDDREVKLNGKNIVSATGGTYRRTMQMAERLGRDIELTRSENDSYIRYRGLQGRIDLIALKNPKNAILHTVLVGDLNGFIHAITTGSKWEDKAGRFNTPPAYTKWIQEN